MGESDSTPGYGAVSVNGAEAAALICALTESGEESGRVAAGLRCGPVMSDDDGTSHAEGAVHGDGGGRAVDVLHSYAARAERAAEQWSAALEACARHLDSTVRAVSEADSLTAEALGTEVESQVGGTMRW